MESLSNKKITFLEGKDYENLKLRDEIKLHAIELPNFYSKNAETLEDEWLIYIKGEDEKIIDKIKEKNEYIKKLDNILVDYWKKEIIWFRR